MLFWRCTKLTFGLSDVFVITVIARNRINGVGSLFFRDRILRFGENMPQSLKRFLSNFNVVAIQNSLDGFSNTLYVRNNSKTSRWWVTSFSRFLFTILLWKIEKLDSNCSFVKPLLNFKIMRREVATINFMTFGENEGYHLTKNWFVSAYLGYLQ